MTEATPYAVAFLAASMLAPTLASPRGQSASGPEDEGPARRAAVAATVERVVHEHYSSLRAPQERSR